MRIDLLIKYLYFIKKFLLISCIAFLLNGCTTTDLYLSSGDIIETRVQIGMTTDEVMNIMGKPNLSGYEYNYRLKERLYMFDYCVQQSNILHGNRHLTIYFKKDKVIDIRKWIEQRFDL